MQPLDNRFYDELGITKSVWQLTAEATWDIWIQNYFNYRKTLQPPQRSNLHTEIDRFWFMVKESKYQPKRVFDLGGKQNKILLEKHRIESPIGHRADLWLKLAGAYVEGQKRGAQAQGRQSGQSPNIEMTIPPGWLQDPTRNQKRVAYNDWLKALTEGGNWAKFVNSYKNDVHGVTIRNKAICASLRSFVNQKYMERYWKGREVKNFGQPLIKPPGQLYWPKVLESYNTRGGGWYLFQAVENEYMSVQVCQATAAGGDPQADMPAWLTIGYNPLKPRSQ